jgi:hypothetical protein
MQLPRLPLLAALAGLALTATASAATRYVNGALATGNNDGTSWADAYRGADAVAVALNAAVAGDELWVAAGTYLPTTSATRTLSHQLKNGVAVYGGFVGNEAQLSQRNHVANVTILSGDIGAPGNNADNSHHVVNGAGTNSTAILDGFTITQGNANVSGSNNDRGGGILCVSGASPTIRSCRFLANRCTFGGGAGYVNAASPTFTDCSFESNVGGSFGGAFDCNTTSVTWDRCTFVSNSAARAGAVELFGTGTPRILNSLFRANTSTGSGGGGGIWIGNNSAGQVRNVTVVGNSSTTNTTAGILVSGAAPTIANCIVWDNVGPGGAQGAANQLAGTAAVTYSIVEGGFAGTGNLALDPQFLNPGANDYRLTIGSPAVDAGNNASMPAGFTLDLAGRPRFANETTVPDTGAGAAPVIDIGAYEFPAPTIESFCFGNGSGTLCPCGNDAPFFDNTGCLSSLGVGGLLAASGVARLSNDTLLLSGTQMTQSTCLYFQGTGRVNGGLGAVFGDGLRCVAGTVVRLVTRTNAGGASQVPLAGEPTVSVRGLVTQPGSLRHYQVWYRNAAAFCTPDTWNLTNGVSVTWEM